MTDIAKCNGKNCPIKKKCWRYTAPTNEYRQTWSDFKYNKKKKKCDHLWKVK